jgi:hypothetical protein
MLTILAFCNAGAFPSKNLAEQTYPHTGQVPGLPRSFGRFGLHENSLKAKYQSKQGRSKLTGTNCQFSYANV